MGTSQATSCPECGAPILGDALKGYCPACLVRLGADGLFPAGVLETSVPAGEGISSKAAAGTPSGSNRGPGAIGENALPTLFGGYELLGEIGRGGMGVVYRARQLAIKRVVALKLLLHGRFSDAAFVERFHLEAEAAAHLDHPNIVPIYEVGQHQGQPYYSMKLVEGQSLEQKLARGPMPPKKAAQLIATVAQAVAFAHTHGVLHRDIKPHNILLDVEGQPHLTDFGLAKLLDQESGLTLSSAVIGSPGFMAPEQAAGKARQVTTAADVYGLGAVLYALLTGKPVFHASTALETVRLVLEQEPVRPRVVNPTLDRDLETICLKCLQKEPAKRYASAQALAEDLESWLRAEPIQARRATQVERVWLWCRRQPVRASLVGALILVFALGLAGVLWQWHRAKAERARAEAGEYAADMHLAQLAWADNNRPLAWGLLTKHRPAPASRSTLDSQLSTDLRAWEWRYLWKLCQGDELFTLYRPRGGVRALDVSKDGKLLAVATTSEVTLWNLATRQQLTGFRTQAGAARAFSPTEDLLAVGGRTQDGQPAVELWDLKARAIVRTLKHQAKVQSLAFSADGQLLATLDFRGNLQVVDWKSEKAFTNLPAGPPSRYSSVGAVAFSPQGRRLAVGEGYGRTRVHDLDTGATVFLETLPVGVTTLAFSPHGDLIAAGYGYGNGAISLCDSRTGKALAQLTNHTTDVHALVFTPDGGQLASASGDGTIRVWNVAQRTQAKCLWSSPGAPTALAMVPDGRTLVSGRWGAVCFYDVAAGNRTPAHTQLRVSDFIASFAQLDRSSFAPERLDPKVVRRAGVAFTPDSRRFLILDTNGAVALWNVHPAQRVEPLPALGSNHWGAALSPDGRWLATGDCVGTVTIWDWTARTEITKFALPFEWFGWLRFSRSGRFLMACAMDNEWAVSLRIRRTADWSGVPLTGTQFAGLWTADVSPDDRFVAAGYGDGKVKLFRNPPAEPVATLTGHTDPVVAVCFFPNGRSLVSVSMDGSARLWDVVARREMTKPLPAGGIFGAALSPDGRRLAAGGGDAVRVWDFVAQRELLTLRDEGQYFFDLKFSPDGNTLAAAGFTGDVHLWRAPSWEEIAAAERKQGIP